jgi:hypothetical protein
MAEQWELDRAFEEGRRVGRLEQLFTGLPRNSILPGAEFAFRRSLFASYVKYERDVVLNQRQLQQLRWLEGRERRRSPDRQPWPGEEALDAAEALVAAELRKVREALDAELAAGHGRRCVVEALRAAPEMPADAVEFASSEEFAAADARRGRGQAESLILAGADFGNRWSLENPFRRWQTRLWRISWICESHKFMYRDDDEVHSDEGEATTELYAEQHSNDPGTGGRVWLLGKLRTRAAVDRALDELFHHAMDERNSLAAAAISIGRVAREEADHLH